MSDLTIRDIARMAGVSATAVSFVLNDRPGVSDATRRRVQEIIRRTGFTPNVHTRRLNLGRSFTIHVVLRWYEDSLHNQFALETLFGIFSVSKSLGYSVMFTFVDDSMDCEQLLESVRRKDCDGVILNQVADLSFITLLQREHIPFVCTDAHVKKDGALPAVEVDYYGAARQAVAHLIARGHTEVGYIGPEAPQEYHQATFRGYADALREAGLSCDPAWVPKIASAESFSPEACIDQLLRGPWMPTALFCAGDIFAVDMIQCAKARGLRVPQDLSIFGLDNLLFARYIDPPLTTMTFDKEQLGEISVRLLHRIMQGEEHEPVTLLPTALVERGTVRDLRR